MPPREMLIRGRAVSAFWLRYPPPDRTRLTGWPGNFNPRNHVYWGVNDDRRFCILYFMIDPVSLDSSFLVWYTLDGESLGAPLTRILVIFSVISK